MLSLLRLVYHKITKAKARFSGTQVGKNALISFSGKLEITGNSSIVIGDCVKLAAGYRIGAHGNSEILIGPSVNFGNEVRIHADHGARIVIEEGCSFNHNVSIYALENITIGQDSIFGPYVYIGDHNHLTDKNQLVKNQSFDTRAISIGNDVWLGVGATVLKGGSVGDGSIVAARAVVNKVIPPYEIWGGVPAKKIGERQAEAAAIISPAP